MPGSTPGAPSFGFSFVRLRQAPLPTPPAPALFQPACSMPRQQQQCRVPQTRTHLDPPTTTPMSGNIVAASCARETPEGGMGMVEREIEAIKEIIYYYHQLLHMK